MSRLFASRTFGTYLVAGIFNTAASYLVYLALLPNLSYLVSYTVSYAAGIVLAFLLYRFLVFRREGRRYAPAWVALVHTSQYLLSLGLVSIFVQVLSGPPAWGPAFALAFSIPMTYLLNRWVFTGNVKEIERNASSN